MSATLAPYLEALTPEVADPSGQDVPGESSQGFVGGIRSAGLHRQACALFAVHVLETLLLLGSWGCIGLGALTGRLDPGWLAAWALALATAVPLHAASVWLQGTIALGLGGLLKQWLLVGAMALDADVVRQKGAGEILSEVLETETIGDLGASGGIATMLALLELLFAPAIFCWGAASVPEVAILVLWLALSVALMVQNARIRADWTRQRLTLTNQLVENMAAHRTRIVQEAPARWHGIEDAELERYVQASCTLDHGSARILAGLPRAYVIVAVCAVVPGFLGGNSTLSELALTVGGILFAAPALQRLTFGFSDVTSTWIAWRIARPLMAAARAAKTRPASSDAEPTPDGIAVLHAQSLSFAHPARHEPVLRGCTLSIHRGDRILLQGDSGSGKSTLAAILSGSRTPAHGFVLAQGLDRATLGEQAWRRRVALAPQFHDNHIVAAPLAFNLLMARPYPYSAKDIEEAGEVCRELGLTALLERMPSGLNQFVGDTGWRLSQGERSRVFLARALLQRAQLIVLDESLAALDPENFRRCLACVVRRAPSLVLIAHP